MDKYTYEQLEARIGQEVRYRGGWGSQPPQLAILENVEYDDGKDGQLVVDVKCGNGALHWGYVYQIEFIE